MFKRPKKKPPKPVSRAGNYMLNESPNDNGPKLESPSFVADPDFFMTSTYLRQGLNSDSSNAENESISSSGTSDDGTGAKKKEKRKGLTFSTFLGTPRLSRRNKDDCDDNRKSKNQEKDTSSLSSREDIPDYKQSTESLKLDGAPAKKQSVISKFKHALTNPKSNKKGLKESGSMQSLFGGKGKPPPPPPKRVSSLTTEGLAYGDTDIGRHFGDISERSSSMDNISASIQVEHCGNVFLTQPDDDRAVKTMSLDVDTINLTMSENPVELDVEKCDTLQSMDDISDDEACASISSLSSHSQVSAPSKQISEPAVEIALKHQLQQATPDACVDAQPPTTNIKVEKSNAITSELNFYLEKIKQKSNNLRKENVEPNMPSNLLRKNQCESFDDTSRDAMEESELLLHAKTPYNTMVEEESMSKLEPDPGTLDPEDSIFMNVEDSNSSDGEDSTEDQQFNSTNANLTDEVSVKESNGLGDMRNDIDIDIDSKKDENEKSGSIGGHPKLLLEDQKPSNSDEIIVDNAEFRLNNYQRGTFTTFGHSKSRKQDVESNSNDSNSEEPQAAGNISNKEEETVQIVMQQSTSTSVYVGPPNTTNLQTMNMHNRSISSEVDAVTCIESNVDNIKTTFIANDTPIAPPRRRRNSKTLSKVLADNSLEIAADDINITDDIANDATISFNSGSSPEDETKLKQGSRHVYSKHAGQTEKLSTFSKPPVTPKPSWVKESMKNGNTPTAPKIQCKDKKAKKEDDLIKKCTDDQKASAHKRHGPISNSCAHGAQVSISKSGSSSCCSDSDTHSSSSYDGKPPRPTNKIRRQDKVFHEDTTDDEMASLKPPSKHNALTSRSTTPTMELYNNISGPGPIGRSLPSPCPDSKQNILVEDDYTSEINMKSLQQSATNLLKQPSSQRGRSMVKSNSVPINLSLSSFDKYEQVCGSKEAQHSRPHTPVHHSKSVEMDIDISNELYSPRYGDGTDLHDIRNRAVTPSIEQIRSFQRSRSAQNDILVENLRYRPSTPLIGGSNIDLRESYSHNKEMFKKRLSTPVGGGRSLTTVEFNDDVMTNPVEISHIDISRHPMKSHPMDMYKSGFATEAGRLSDGHSNVYGSVAEQWSSFNVNSIPDRRPPSPVLRAKVNSVLDNLMSRPVGPAIHRTPLIRSQSVDKLLTSTSFVLPPPISDDRLTPRGNRHGEDLVYDRNSRPSTPVIPLRPPSPFQLPLPISRLGYFDNDIDVEFPTPPHVVSQRRDFNQVNLQTAISVPNLNTTSHSLVPPLNLDFTRERSEQDDMCYSGRNPMSGRSTNRIQNNIHIVTDINIDNNNSETLSNIKRQGIAQQSSGPKYRQEEILPAPSNQPQKEIRIMPFEQQNSVDSSVLKDDELDVSTACLELSNPASSDSEAEDHVTSSDVLNCGWQRKSAEEWVTSDVVDWCFSNTFYQAALIFKENQMTGADLLLISDRHLVDLGLHHDKEREEFMSEVEKLRLKPRSAASLWRLKQTSMKRRNLEASSELLKERLHNLQQLSSHQNQRINSSMEEVIQHQRQTDELLGIKDQTSPNSNGSGGTCQDHGHDAGFVPEIQMDVPLIKWTKDDVTTWLKASELERFADKFQAYNVTGKDLAAVDMQLLDKLGIDSTEDRELFLSKLYDLQRPIQESSQEEAIDLRGSNQNSPPSELPDRLTDTSGLGTKSSGEINGENHVMDNLNTKTVNGHSRHTSFQNKFKDIVTPRKFGARHKEMDTIRIWHDVSGTSMSTEIKISESTTSEEVVQKVLHDLEITDDINLFFLTVSSTYIEEGEKELGKFECPLSVQRSSQGGNCRFDLRRRLGITIKVICQVSNMKPRGKGFRVSPYSTCTEVLQVALRKFAMSHVDSNLFCLLPINKETGDVRMMGEHEVVQDCESDAFILSNHDNTDQLLASPEALPLIQQSKQILRRNSSLNSHGSSGLSQSSETSQGSDSGKPRNEKLESLEAMMADIEASLSAKFQEEELQKAEVIRMLPPTVHVSRISPSGRSLNYNHQTDFVPHASQFNNNRYVTPRKQKLPSSDKYVPQDLRSDEHLELMREIALMRESVQERDSTISNLKLQIDNLNTHSKEVEELKSQLYEFQVRQKEIERQWQDQLSSTQRALEVKQHQLENANQALQAEQQKVRLHEDDDSDSGRETNRSTRGSAPGSTTDLSLDIDQLERELEVIQSDVRSQEEQLNDLRARRQKAVEESKLSGSTINVQLLGEDCTIVEAKLLRAKQKHADIYAKLELTKKEQLRNRQGQAQAPSLFDVLSPGINESILSVDLSNTDGHGFIHGRDSHHRLVIKHVAEGQPLQKGDRILEVNGRSVFHLDDQEFALLLRQARKPIKLVLVRDKNSHGGGHSDQDIEAMKEDLAMAMIEVESAQQENQDLTEEVQKLKRSNRDVCEENQKLRDEIQSMKKQVDETAAEQEKLKSLLKLQVNESSAKKKTRFGDDFYSGSTDSENGRLTRSNTESDPEEVIAYHLLDENVPLWESLKTASKKEILQVLKDHILETSQQKNYLDQLMTVVIDNAPNLLEHMDSETDLITSLCWKPQSEEFC